MTDSNHDYETIPNFIKQRLIALASAADAEARESSLQGVTVRLPQGDVALIDHFAKELEYSRQQLLAHLIGLALDDTCKAWADESPKGKQAEVYRALQEIRSGKEG